MYRQAKTTNAAFTLLEVVVVIVIVATLVSLALPRLFKAIERSYMPEALLNIRLVREAVERCALMGNGDICECVSGNPWYEGLGLENPDLNSGAQFTYVMTEMCNKPQSRYRFRATRKTGNGSIELFYVDHQKQGERFTITGSGVYEGVEISSK